MSELPTLQFFNKKDSDILNVLLHGGNFNIETPFMQKLFNLSWKKGRSSVSFNFPYIDRGDKTASSNLDEEIKILQKVLDFVEYRSYSKIHFIGKSMGAIVAGKFLKQKKLDYKKYSITVLGYVTEGIDIKDFKGNITIIQGSKDKFGNIEKVKEDMGVLSDRVRYFEINGAEHSFKDSEGKETYVDEAFSKIDF